MCKYTLSGNIYSFQDANETGHLFPTKIHVNNRSNSIGKKNDKMASQRLVTAKLFQDFNI